MPKKYFSKTKLAELQLNRAISIFLSRTGESDLACALTLSGAAEEIFGKALAHRGESNWLESSYDAMKPVRQLFSRKPGDRKDYADEVNHARNSLKHMRDDNDLVALDLDDDACSMIVRACDNYQRLGLAPTSQMHEFEDWFYRNIVGIDEPA